MNTTTVNIPVTIRGKDSKGYTVFIDEATISFKVGWNKPEELQAVVSGVTDMLKTEVTKIIPYDETPLQKALGHYTCKSHLEKAKEYLDGYFTHTEDSIDSRTNWIESSLRELIKHLEE